MVHLRSDHFRNATKMIWLDFLPFRFTLGALWNHKQLSR
jgi:hypothetical protein